LQDGRDIDPQGAESVGVEPIRLSLGGTEEVSHRCPAQPVQKSKNPAFLHDEGETPVEQRL
jgi:hypothetical protein